MKQSLKVFVAGVIFTLFLLGGYQGYATYTHLTAAAQQAEASYKYLAEPIGKNDKGEAVTRAMVIDAMIQKVGNAGTNPPVPVGGTPQTP